MDYTPAVKSPAADAGAGRLSGDAAWCPVIVQVSESGESAPRETVVRACDSRVRKRLIYTSRGSQVRVTMPLTAALSRPARHPVIGYYILYFEGNDKSSAV